MRITGVYFIEKSGRDFAIQFHSLESHATRTLMSVGSGYAGFSVSPDQKWLLYTLANPQGNDLMLVEHFR